MLTEKNLKRYPKNLMKLTKQSVALDEELQELFLAASKRACTAPEYATPDLNNSFVLKKRKN